VFQECKVCPATPPPMASGIPPTQPTEMIADIVESDPCLGSTLENLLIACSRPTQWSKGTRTFDTFCPNKWSVLGSGHSTGNANRGIYSSLPHRIQAHS
jgi:hypothetical protein